MRQEVIKTQSFECAYPEAIERLIALGLVNFDLWYLMGTKQTVQIGEQLREQYRNEKWIPFARRGDNEDIACFEVDSGQKVVVLRSYELLGYRQCAVYDSVWDWFRDAIEVMIAF